MINALAHYLTVGSVVAVTALSVGIGEGMASISALQALALQPRARQSILRVLILGIALIETAAVIGLTIGIMLLGDQANGELPALHQLSHIGIACALAISGGVLGITSAWPVQQAALAVARQPFFADRIQSIMLLTQSLMQTPVIFSFIVSLFIRNQSPEIQTLGESLRCIAAGIAIGVGSVGPGLGLGLFSAKACKSAGLNRDAFTKIVRFTFISEAIIETPLIFALLVALLILQLPVAADASLMIGIGCIAGALSIGLGTIGAGISSGRVSSIACEEIALHPEQHTVLSKTSMLAQGLIDTCAIYALLIALLLLLKP